jgi:phage terminase large subunit
MSIKAQFPAKLRPLFAPKRYKVMHGGRGGGKSWAVARALILMVADDGLRVLCAREVQKSMKESVHRLLKDQITALGLDSDFDVLETEIRCKNGGGFVFTGLQSHTVDSIKSFEGCDRVWVEEAHGVSKRSWDTLTPTIRKPGSEIWMTLNPDMDTDPTYVMFMATPSDDTWVCQINHSDNPWFPQVLEDERQKAQRTMSKDDYEHIWEGKPRRVAEGAIYRHEIDALFTDGRICEVPYDPELPVHAVWDLGWNDSMTIIMAQRTPMAVRVIDYMEDSNRTYDWFVNELNKRPYRWGHDFLPHDGVAANPQTGISSIQTLQKLGRNVWIDPEDKEQKRSLERLDIEEGIKQARMVFPKCYFDKNKTARLVECLKRYRRAINQRTNEATTPLHDEFSHGADAFRYLGMAVPRMKNDAALQSESINKFANRQRDGWR